MADVIKEAEKTAEGAVSGAEKVLEDIAGMVEKAFKGEAPKVVETVETEAPKLAQDVAADASKVAQAAEAEAPELFHVVITSAKAGAHALGDVASLAWEGASALIEGGKARPASPAEVAAATAPAAA